MKFSLCIGAYSGKDEIYHLEKIKEHGLHGLEYYAWWDLPDIRRMAKEQERIGVGINATCTKFISLVNESLRDAYIEGVRQSIEACKILNVRSMITQTGNVLDGIPRYIQRANMIETLKRCAPLLEEAGVVLEIEPLNGIVDHAGHFSQRSDESVYIVDQVGSRNVKLVFDVYHQQITEGNVTRNAVNYIDRINHFHIADNPGRKQPGTGELNYVHILKSIKGTGFDGFVGLECGYTVDTDIAIEQFKRDIVTPALG
ncbi:TIM barrel protein [Paenibacillus albus]|uniref:Xylose isomerase n=1 Tax=Paenibacillus albus TaxID=2495582 RepID=A0A3S9A7S6_9BACL|nr:TIM barrel protein [Paenibacillus albus]AZN41753.1 xylose isomerase [Paenibacillus albus]